MRYSFAKCFIGWLVVLACVTAVSCKAVQTVRCISSSLKPVVVIGTNGLPYTISVPFCDTLQVVPKVPDSLRMK